MVENLNPKDIHYLFRVTLGEAGGYLQVNQTYSIQKSKYDDEDAISFVTTDIITRKNLTTFMTDQKFLIGKYSFDENTQKLYRETLKMLIMNIENER